MQRIKQELKYLEEINQLRKIPNIQNKYNNKLSINEHDYINFASNDYLNLSTNMDLITEFKKINNSLFSSASARLLTGSSTEFTELEEILSNLFEKESCLIFNSGYQCNLGVISTLCSKGDVIFSDKLNHASIIDGMRLAEGDFIRYKHLDYANLENILKTKRNLYNRAIIVSESVFSMDGDIADINKLIELKNKYNCILMVDEAHAFCAIGKSLTGISGNKDVDIITATFGKALGSFGAFCVSNNDIISYLTNKARSFIFSTSIPPINIAWTKWLLSEKKNIIIKQKDKLENLIIEINRLYPELQLKSQILPIIIGSNDKTNEIAENLKNLGYYIPAIRPPTVPERTSRLRISLTADSNIQDIINIINFTRAIP